MPMPEAPRMYLIVMYRPFPAAPLVVRCMYMAVVPGPTPHCSAASFEVNSEPHTGARPSVRLCVGLTELH
jgi:hypothetical protein